MESQSLSDLFLFTIKMTIPSLPFPSKFLRQDKSNDNIGIPATIHANTRQAYYYSFGHIFKDFWSDDKEFVGLLSRTSTQEDQKLCKKSKKLEATAESSMVIVEVEGSGSSCTSEGDDTLEFSVWTRDKPPAHYMLRIESFSLLSQLLQITAEKRYESLAFKAGGYKWKLSLDPNGGKGSDGHGDGHISLYLMIVETDTLPLGWMIDVNFKLFVYDQIRDKYCVFEDAKARRFHAMKTEWGSSKLLSHKDFTDACNGYLVGDTCVFGAEMYVENENYSGVGECLSMLNTKDEGFTWKIDNFSVLDKDVIESRTFIAGGHEWSLSLYPKGDSSSDGESLTLHLNLNDAESIPPEQKIGAQFMIRVKDHLNNEHCSQAGAAWFFSTVDYLCYSNFMPLRDLKDPSNGFLVNDTLIIEFKLDVASSIKKFT